MTSSPGEGRIGDEVIFGIKAISAEIDRNERQTSYLIAKGIIPVKRRGRQVTTTKAAIRRALIEDIEN